MEMSDMIYCLPHYNISTTNRGKIFPVKTLPCSRAQVESGYDLTHFLQQLDCVSYTVGWN